MATRYRWLRLNTDLKFSIVQKRLLDVKFSEISDDWFSESNNEPEKSIHYYWRTAITALYLDKNNDQVFQSVPTLSVVEFSLFEYKNFIYIRIKNPPRSVSMLANALERILGFGVWFENINMLANGRAALLRNLPDARLVSVKATNVKLTESVMGRIEAVSKELIPDDLLVELSMYPNLIDFCSYEVLIEGVKGQVSFYRNGQVKVGDNISGIVLSIVESML